MASWRIRFHDKWPHLASLYASTHNLDEDGKHPDPMMGQDNVFDPSEPYGAYRFYMQPSSRSEFSIEEPPYMSRPVYKDEESKSSGYTSGGSLGRGSTCRVLLCVFLVVSFIGVVVAAITLAILLSQMPTPLRRKANSTEEFESTASIFARDFNDKLLDNSTDEFLSLEEEFCNAIEQIFTESESPVKHAFGGCEVIEFINGSIQVRYRLKLVSKSPETFKMNNKILQKLQEHFAKKVNEIGPWQKLKFNPRFIKQFIRIEPPTTSVPVTVASTVATTTETTQKIEVTTGHTDTVPDISTTQDSPKSTTFEGTINITGVATEWDITTIHTDEVAVTNATDLPDTVAEKEILAETETTPYEFVTETVTVTQPMESTTTNLATNATQSIDSTTISILSSNEPMITIETMLNETDTVISNDTAGSVNVTTFPTPKETTPDWFDFFYDYSDDLETTETSVATDGLPTTTESGILSKVSDATSSPDVSSPSVVEENATSASEAISTVQPSTMSTESTFAVDTTVETTVISTVLQTTPTQNATVQITSTDTVLITETTAPVVEILDISTDATVSRTEIVGLTTQAIPTLSNVTDSSVVTVDTGQTTVADTTESHITLATTQHTTDTTHDITTTEIVSLPSSNVTSAVVEDEVDMTTESLNITSDAPETTTVHVIVNATSSDIVNITELTLPETTTIVNPTTAAHETKELPIVTGQLLVESTTAVSNVTTEKQNVTEMPVHAVSSETSDVIISTEAIKIESTMSTDTANATEPATIKLIKTSPEAVRQTTDAGIEVDLTTKPDVMDFITGRVDIQTTPEHSVTPALSTATAVEGTTSVRSTTGVFTEVQSTMSPEANETSSIARPEITTYIPVENITQALEGVSDIALLSTDMYDYNTSEYYDYETTTAESFLFDMSTDIPVDYLTTSERTDTGSVQATTVALPLMPESTEEYLEVTNEQKPTVVANQTTEAPRQVQNDSDSTGVTIRQITETGQTVTDISSGVMRQTTIGTAISELPVTTQMEHTDDKTTQTHSTSETTRATPSDTTTEDPLVTASSEAENTTQQSTTTATDAVAVATATQTANISQVDTLEMDRILVTTDAPDITVSRLNLTMDVPVEGRDGNATEHTTTDIDGYITIVSGTVMKATTQYAAVTTDMPIETKIQTRNESSINATESTLNVTGVSVIETATIDTSNDTLTLEATVNATSLIDGEHNTTLDIQTTTATTKSSESAFLDEYGEAAFIEEYIPTSSNITEETSVLTAVYSTAAVPTTASLPKDTNVSLLVPETNVTDIAMEDMLTESSLTEANLTLISDNETLLADTLTGQSTVAKHTGITLEVTTTPESNITDNTAMTTDTHLATASGIVETSSIPSNETELIKKETDTEWIPETIAPVQANITLKSNVTELSKNETDTEWIPETTVPVQANDTLKSNVTEFAMNETDTEWIPETTVPVQANATLKSNVTDFAMNETDTGLIPETTIPVQANATLKSNVTEFAMNETDTGLIPETTIPVQANATLKSNVTELTMNETDTEWIPETTVPVQANATLKSNVTELTMNETDADWIPETLSPVTRNVTLPSNVTELVMNETISSNVTTLSNITETIVKETTTTKEIPLTTAASIAESRPKQRNLTETAINETTHHIEGNATALSNATSILLNETAAAFIPDTIDIGKAISTNATIQNVTMPFNDTTGFTASNETLVHDMVSNATTQSPNIAESSTELYNYNTSDYYYYNDTDYYYDDDNATTKAPVLNVTQSTVFSTTGIAATTSAETSTTYFNGTVSNETHSTTTHTPTLNVTESVQTVTETLVLTDVTTITKHVP